MRGPGEPLLLPEQWTDAARLIRARADRPVTFPPPAHWARALGVRRYDTGPCCGLLACGAHDGIHYQDDPDPRVRGLRIAHGLVQVVAARWTWGITYADVIGITAELAWPSHLRPPATDDEAIDANGHAPEWLIRARLARLRD